LRSAHRETFSQYLPKEPKRIFTSTGGYFKSYLGVDGVSIYQDFGFKGNSQLLTVHGADNFHKYNSTNWGNIPNKSIKSIRVPNGFKTITGVVFFFVYCHPKLKEDIDDLHRLDTHSWPWHMNVASLTIHKL
jgi:hypothetical protein